MLRRKFSISPTSNIFKFSPCSISTKYFCSSPPDQQQQQKVPDVLKQFDQLMKTNPKFRQLYPKLLTAIVSKSKSEISAIANAMIDASEPKESTTKVVATSSNDETTAKKENGETQIKNNLNLIVVDVAFADMFYHGEEEQAEAEGEASNALQQEEIDEQLLELLLSYYQVEFKQQKARIGKFIVKIIEEERDNLMIQEKGLKLLRSRVCSSISSNNNNNNNNNRGVLPNFAINVTPPIDENNTITAAELLKQIQTEIPIMADFLDGGKQAVVTSVLRRRVFSGAVIVTSADREEVEKLTQLLFEKQKKKAVGDVEFDPDVQMMACRVAVENDLVEKRRKNNNNNNDSTKNLLRFDIGIEENSFAKAIGLDLFFDFEKDGDVAVRQVDECANEICKRVSNRLNSGFRSTSESSSSTSKFEEEAILPFAFTMRCKVVS